MEDKRLQLIRASSGDGTLPKFAWPGGYPMFYMDKQANTICPDCANREIDETQAVVYGDINWEDATMYCDDCQKRIESAYAENV